MGCGSSKSLVVVKESPLSEALERKLIHAVISTKRRKSFVVKKSSFNNLMLQMPRLTAGFKKIREAYAKASGRSGQVKWGEFRTLNGLQLWLDPESDTLKEVLTMPEVSDDVLVTHADFIIIYTVVYLIDGTTKRRTIQAHEVRACLELMEKSFMFFDSSADGCIERKELALALKSGTRVFGRKVSKTLADRLFDQLDWSKDGQITFKEYLVGMERIIIETAGDEEEYELDEDVQTLDVDSGDENGQQEADGNVDSLQPKANSKDTLGDRDLSKDKGRLMADKAPQIAMVNGKADEEDEVVPF